MDIFLNPNVAYLILVVGFLIAIMALLTPGTGFLEVGGLFLLLIAGWQIYNLNFNLIALIVLIVGVFPFLLALRKTGKMVSPGDRSCGTGWRQHFSIRFRRLASSG